MSKTLFVTALVIGFAGAASAATLSASSCSSSGATVTWSVTDVTNASITISGGSNSSEIEISVPSGSITSDFAQVWGGSDNSNLSFELLPMAALCQQAAPEKKCIIYIMRQIG